MPKQKKGFTLIELLVVIAIIGILSAIGLVSLNGAREKARDSKRESDLAQIKSAMALYYDDNSSTYYKQAGSLEVDASSAQAGFANFKAAMAPYLQNLPQPARTSDVGNDQAYYYVSNAGGTTFAVFSKLEGTQNGVQHPWYILNEVGFGGAATVGSSVVATNVQCNGATSGALNACASTPAIQP